MEMEVKVEVDMFMFVLGLIAWIFIYMLRVGVWTMNIYDYMIVLTMDYEFFDVMTFHLYDCLDYGLWIIY
jgi:hypothetical protein